MKFSNSLSESSSTTFKSILARDALYPRSRIAFLKAVKSMVFGL
jgi:hypothetical protein